LRELRAVLALVPPFLADLVRQVVVARAAKLGLVLHLVVQSDDSGDLRETISRFRPDVVILGPAAETAHAALLSSKLRVLTLSPDLALLEGPGLNDSAPLTPEILAQRLFELSRTIEPASTPP
jgi:hypothetical protein